MPRTDIGWQHGTPVGNDAKKCQCNYCGKVIASGVTRLKQHLAGSSFNVVSCKLVPPSVREEMHKHLSERALLPVRKEQQFQQLHGLQPQGEEAVNPQPKIEQDMEEVVDPELKIQQDIEEALRRSKEGSEFRFQQELEEALRQSKEDPAYKEIEDIQFAMQESRRLSSQYIKGSSSSQAPEPIVLIEDSDEESIPMLRSSDEEEDDF